jgi:hypothetical protein
MDLAYHRQFHAVFQRITLHGFLRCLIRWDSTYLERRLRLLNLLLRIEPARKAVGGIRHQINHVDVVVYASRGVLAAVLETEPCFARDQSASQDRGRQA